MAKTEAAYKAEYNSLVVGATAMLERAVQVRKNLTKVARGNHSTSPNGSAASAAHKAVSSLKTYKGEFERNPGKK